jgi:hypothetical protein
MPQPFFKQLQRLTSRADDVSNACPINESDKSGTRAAHVTCQVKEVDIERHGARRGLCSRDSSRQGASPRCGGPIAGPGFGLRGARGWSFPIFSRFMINSRCRSKARRVFSKARSIDTATAISGGPPRDPTFGSALFAGRCTAGPARCGDWPGLKCSLSRVASVTAASPCPSLPAPRA